MPRVLGGSGGPLGGINHNQGPGGKATLYPLSNFVVFYCNFRSLAFLGLLGFLIRQAKVQFIATLLSAAKLSALHPKP